MPLFIEPSSLTTARVRTAILALGIGLGGATRVSAQPPPEAPAPDAPPRPDTPPPPVTALDGDARNLERAPEPSRVYGGEVLRGLGIGASWIVRGVMAPARGLIYVEARWGTLTKIRKLLVNDAGTLGIYPTVGFASDFGLTYGAKAFSKNYFGAHEELSISASTGGFVREAFQAKLELPHLGGSPIYVRTRARFEDNGNQIFAGIGNSTVVDGTMLAADAGAVRTRFSQTRYLALLSSGIELGEGTRVRIGGSAILNDRSFGPAASGTSDPSIETVYDTSTLRGFTGGFRTLELTGDLEIDARDVKGATQSGAVVRAFAGGGSLVEDSTYGHYGAEASAYLTPFWPHRVFVGRVAVEGIIDDDNDIPFTELPRLGGAGLLRGYNSGTFRDRTLGIATLEYRYPIHENLYGELFVEAGKVARSINVLTNGDDWHLGYGGGVIVHTRSAVKIRLDLAYGDGLQVYFSTDVLDAFRKRDREL